MRAYLTLKTDTMQAEKETLKGLLPPSRLENLEILQKTSRLQVKRKMARDKAEREQQERDQQARAETVLPD